MGARDNGPASSRFLLHPRRLLHALDSIDRDWLDPGLGGWRRPASVLVLVIVALLAIHYLKFHSTLREILTWAVGAGGARDLLHGTWGPLLGEVWWGLVHLFGYVLLPLVYLRCSRTMRAVDAGLRWCDTTRWLGWYVLLAVPIVGFAYVASFSDTFTHTYPFYVHAGRSWADLVAWELIYLSQFLFLEFFFRGFMLEALAPRLGAASVFVMAVPYTMIHFAKPWPEAAGAVVFGIALGILALRTRSIWGGVLVHATIALSMDLMSLAQARRWPGQWWPP